MPAVSSGLVSVLLVGTHIDVVLAMVETFDRARLELRLAGTLQEALDAAAERTPDVVVVDLDDASGPAIVRGLHDVDPDLGVITVCTESEKGRRALADGASATCSRPVRPERLHRSIENVHRGWLRGA